MNVTNFSNYPSLCRSLAIARSGSGVRSAHRGVADGGAEQRADDYADNAVDAAGNPVRLFPRLFPSLCARVTEKRIFLGRVSAYARAYEIRRERAFLRAAMCVYFSNSPK